MSASGVVAGVEQRETALFPSVSSQMTALCGRQVRITYCKAPKTRASLSTIPILICFPR